MKWLIMLHVPLHNYESYWCWPSLEKYSCYTSSKVFLLAIKKKNKKKIDRKEIYLQKWKIKFHRSEFLIRTGVHNSVCYGNIVTMTSSHKHSKQMLYIVDVRVEQLLVNMWHLHRVRPESCPGSWARWHLA